MATLRDHLMTSQQATQLSREYESKNYSFINAHRNASTPDSKEYYYDISILEEYLAFVKQEAANKGYKNVGVMVKMGQYPEDDVIDPRQNPAYKGYQNTFFAPFTTDENGKRTMITDIDSLNFAGLCPP